MKMAYIFISSQEAADEPLCVTAQVHTERIQVTYLQCVIWLRIQGCTRTAW